MKSVLLCLDSGTTAVKAAAFDMRGRMVAVAQRDNAALRRDGVRVEQDMDLTRSLALDVLADCRGQIDGAVAGIVVTGQGDGLWPVDADLCPVGHAITWLDGRARDLTARFHAEDRFTAIESVTGSRPTAASQSVQLAWLERHEPHRLAHIHRVLRAKEWLFLSLTGALKAEPSAALPVWGDWRSGKVSRVIQEALGLTRGVELLPDFKSIRDCTAGLEANVAETLSVPAGTPVLLGPGDVQATLIGLGLGSSSGVARASIFGTSAIHACFLQDPSAMREKPAGAMMQRFALGPGYFCFHPSFNGATLLQHLRTKLDGQPERVEPSLSPLILHPFFERGGERAPYTTPHASGALLGLNADTSTQQIAWAGREALAFLARKSHDMMGSPEGRFVLGGGLAADDHFADFLATVLDQPVAREGGGHAGLRGLAIVGARLIEGFAVEDGKADWEHSATAVSMPDPALSSYADTKFRLFERTIETVSAYWEELSDLSERTGDFSKEQIR